jgi:hypothetical protein
VNPGVDRQFVQTKLFFIANRLEKGVPTMTQEVNHSCICRLK